MHNLSERIVFTENLFFARSCKILTKQAFFARNEKAFQDYCKIVARRVARSGGIANLLSIYLCWRLTQAALLRCSDGYSL